MGRAITISTLAVGALASCPLLHAQNAHLTGTMAWTEVVAGTTAPVGTPNGVLDPGESARVRFSLSFAPQVGQPVRYQLAGGGFGLAPVAGLASSIFALNATGALGGDWSLPLAMSGFIADLGFVDPSTGSIVLASVYQDYPTPGAFPLATNPLPDAWTAVWTPSVYDPRLVRFDAQQGTSAGGLFVQTGLDPLGNPLFSYATAFTSSYGEVQIPVVPAPPGVVATLVLCFAEVLRRRR